MAACPSQLAAVRCIAFDLDDTLWSMVETISAAHDAMAACMSSYSEPLGQKYGSAATFQELAERVKQEHPDKACDFTFVRKGALRYALAEFDVAGGDDVVDICFDAFQVQRNRPQFLPGAIDTLKELQRRGFHLGAVTDGNADVFKIVELTGLFDFSVSASEVGASKPDPRIFQRALEKAGRAATEVLFVGDNFSKDVKGPSKVGMPAVWVHNPAQTAHPLFSLYHWGTMPDVPEKPEEDAVAVIQGVPELLKLVGPPPE